MAEQRYFYATGKDMATVLARLEENADFKYLRLRERTSHELETLTSVLDIPDFLTTPNGGMHREFYLWQDKPTPKPHSFVAKDGITYYRLAPRETGPCLSLQEYGVYDANTIIVSRYFVHGKDPEVLKLFRALNLEIKSDFANVRGNWVGPEALKLLKTGARLAAFLNAPSANDLTLEDQQIVPDAN